MNRVLMGLITTLALPLLSACGPGEGGTGGALPSVGIGRIDGFGSAIIEADRVDDSSAQVTIDEDPGKPIAAPITAVKLGAQIEALVTTGVLNSGTVGAEVIGPIESITPDESAIRILGQRIVIAGHPVLSPVIDGFQAGDFFAGDFAEVHGVRLSNGDILATRLERRADVRAVFRLAGIVAQLDLGTRTFAIGEQRVSFGTATVLPAGKPLANGQRVTVVSEQSNTPSTGASGVLLTARTIRTDIPNAIEGAQIAVTGPVSEITAGPRFKLRGFDVQADAAQFATGQSASLLGVDSLVRVRGTITGGVLRAQSISLLRTSQDAPISITAAVSDFSSGDATFRMRGATVGITPSTQFIGGDGNNIANGVVLYLRGQISEGVVQAERIEFVDPPRVVAGVVSQLDTAAGSFLLPPQARAIRISPATQFRGGTITELANNRRVRVAGTATATAFEANEVTFLDSTSPSATVLLTGLIGDRGQGNSFYLNGKLITFDAATRFSGGPSGTSADLASLEGAVAIVRVVTRGSVLTAVSVDFRPTVDPANSALGYVSNFTSLADLRVAGQRVDMRAAQVTGGTAADVRDTVFVLVQGAMSSGVLVATRVEILQN